MPLYDSIISRLPGVADPKTHLNFRSRLKWTGIILLLFLVLGQITLFGITPTAKERFQFLELIFGASFGTLLTLGIGPIVTSSIILQLLVGSKIIPWNLKTTEGKKMFQGTQKLLTIFFCIFEAYAYVAFGAIQAAGPETMSLVIVQLAFGGFLVLLMDEVISKYGIGSGVSVLIAAGVTKGIFVRAFNPLTPLGETVPAGLIPQFVVLLSRGEVYQSAIALLPIIATILVFLIVVYVQAIKIEIPLALGSVRGFSRRWPLNLIYTSNIPVILVAALVANMQLVGTMFARGPERCGILGCFDEQGSPTSGVVYFLTPPNALPVQMFFLVLLAAVFLAAFMAFYFRIKSGQKIVLASGIVGFLLAIAATNSFVGLPTVLDSLRAVTYMLFFVVGAITFSVFWISTSGMDSRSVAEQIEGLGMQVPGFRRDPRIVEQVLNRYIPTLAVLSGLFLGVLASVADFTSALGTGTGILLTVMILYNLYEQISMRYVEDMHPAVRKFFE